LIRLDPESWKPNSIVEIDWEDGKLPFNINDANLDIYIIKVGIRFLSD